MVHYGFIESFIEELGVKYNIKEIAFDRWGAVQMTQNLEALGFSVVPFGQGFKDIGITAAEDLTGAKIDDNHVVVSGSEDGGAPVAVGFRAKKANGKYRYFWLYRVVLP